MSVDEDIWKRRFFTLMLWRLAGTVTVLMGLLVGFSDMFVEGGQRIFGIVLIGIGLFDLAILPGILRKRWRDE